MTSYWQRYYLENDEVKVERIDPSKVLDITQEYWLPGGWMPPLRVQESVRRFYDEEFNIFNAPDPIRDLVWEINKPLVRGPYLKHLPKPSRWVLERGRRVGVSSHLTQLIETITPPYVRYRDPYTTLSPVAAAVKIALDGSVN